MVTLRRDASSIRSICLLRPCADGPYPAVDIRGRTKWPMTQASTQCFLGWPRAIPPQPRGRERAKRLSRKEI